MFEVLDEDGNVLASAPLRVDYYVPIGEGDFTVNLTDSPEFRGLLTSGQRVRYTGRGILRNDAGEGVPGRDEYTVEGRVVIPIPAEAEHGWWKARFKRETTA